MQPKVSVITIFRNEEQFIEEAIESVFAQTCDAWELLLVDDGSTDGSTAIAQQCAERWPEKIRYLSSPGNLNRGMSAARNLGIAHARGDYVAFLDADDVWMPNKLEQQLPILESHTEVAMIYGPTMWWYSWPGNPEDHPQDFVFGLHIPQDTLLHPPALLARFIKDEGISPCTCSVLLRKEIVEQVGGFEPTFRGFYEDQVFFAKVSLAAPIYVSTECSAKYRQHPNSYSSINQKPEEHAAARYSFLNWLAEYLLEKGNPDAELWKALRRELLPHQHPKLYFLIRRARQGLPGRLYRAVQEYRLRWRSLPVIRQLRSLQFRRLQPIGNGRQRGTPIVRYYWYQFLQKHQADIRGSALEVGTTATIRKYGGRSVTQADAIDLSAHSPEVSVVADLSRGDKIPSDHYDCFINQFTMHLLYDVESALYHSIRIIKPGGVLLINFPCVDYYFHHGLDMGTGETLFIYWWFTPIQVENLLRRVGLNGENYSLEIYGNLFTRIAYQMNIPSEELTQRELQVVDLGHPLLICVRVLKPVGWQAERPSYREPWRPEGLPARWSPETGHYAA